MPNIFRQAYEIVTIKTGGEMTDEERKVVALATAFVANQLGRVVHECDDLPVNTGLLRLAKIAEEAE